MIIYSPEHNPLTPEELEHLISGCQRQRRQEQEKLYSHFGPKMYGVCLRYARNRDEAQDFFHDGFVHAFAKMEQYRFTGSFEGWLRRVFVTRILEHFRKEKLLFATGDVSEYEHQIADSGSADQLTAEELMALVAQLSPQYRMVFNLYAIEGYTHQEIASLLGISEGTSKSNLARARQWLQQKIRENYPDEGRSNGRAK